MLGFPWSRVAKRQTAMPQCSPTLSSSNPSSPPPDPDARKFLRPPRARRLVVERAPAKRNYSSRFCASVTRFPRIRPIAASITMSLRAIAVVLAAAFVTLGTIAHEPRSERDPPWKRCLFVRHAVIGLSAVRGETPPSRRAHPGARSIPVLAFLVPGLHA